MAETFNYEMKLVAHDMRLIESLVSLLDGRLETHPWKPRMARSAEITRKTEQPVDGLVTAIVVGTRDWGVLGFVRVFTDGSNATERLCERFDEACRRLKVGAEVWSESRNMGTQEHLVIDFRGNVLCYEQDTDWCGMFSDEFDGKDVNGDMRTGYPDFGVFGTTYDIYNGIYPESKVERRGR